MPFFGFDDVHMTPFQTVQTAFPHTAYRCSFGTQHYAASALQGHVVMYGVMTAALDREWWQHYRRDLQLRFKQEEMAVRSRRSSGCDRRAVLAVPAHLARFADIDSSAGAAPFVGVRVLAWRLKPS